MASLNHHWPTSLTTIKPPLNQPSSTRNPEISGAPADCGGCRAAGAAELRGPGARGARGARRGGTGRGCGSGRRGRRLSGGVVMCWLGDEKCWKMMENAETYWRIMKIYENAWRFNVVFDTGIDSVDAKT